MKWEIILTPKKNTFDTGLGLGGHHVQYTLLLHYVRGETQYAACVLSLALQR